MPGRDCHPKVEQCCLDAAQKFGVTRESLGQAAGQLLASAICPGCVLRALDCQDDSLYLECHQTLARSLRMISGEPEGENTPEDIPICTICLGLLQPKGYVGMAERVKQAIATEGYDAKDCDTNAALPIAALVRSKLFWCHVRSLVPSLAPEEGLPSIKQVLRMLVGRTLEASHGMRYTEQGSLHITISLSHEETSQEHLVFQKGHEFVASSGFVPKWDVLGMSRSKVGENLKGLSDEAAIKFHMVPCKPVTSAATVDNVELLHDSLFIAGRYLKLSRGVSQTPWVVNGRCLAEHSVSEFIAGPLQHLFKCTTTNFVTAGREDADVRMLGTGRPYSMEVCNPRQTCFDDLPAELEAMTARINRSKLVNTTPLRLISKKAIDVIKEGEQTKVKTYRALVWVATPIADQASLDELLSETISALPLNVMQLTPLRVLHRRSPLTRPKVIHQLRAKWRHPHFIVIDLVAEAGTYIKEFVHGDVGRTMPSLASILGQPSADLLELDVIHVDLEWPPAQFP